MPRKTPTVFVDTPGNFDVKPLKYIAEYLTSKEYEKWFMKPQCFDSPGDEVESFYINNNEEYKRFQIKLKQLQMHKKENAKLIIQRIAQMEQFQVELRKNIIRRNDYMREIDDKLKESKKTINEQILLQKQIMINIASRKISLNEMISFRKKLKSTNDEYAIYEKVLYDAVKKSDTFSSVKMLINYCDGLMRGEADIAIMNEKLYLEIDEMKNRISEIIKEAELIALGLKTELSEMERYYKKASSVCLIWENLSSKAVRARFSVDLRRERSRDGIQFMYKLLCKALGKFPELSRLQTEKQLDFIRSEMEILTAVVNEYNKRTYFC